MIKGSLYGDLDELNEKRYYNQTCKLCLKTLLNSPKRLLAPSPFRISAYSALSHTEIEKSY